MGNAIAKQRLLDAHNVLQELWNARYRAGAPQTELDGINATMTAVWAVLEAVDAPRAELKPLAKVIRMRPVMSRTYRGKP